MAGLGGYAQQHITQLNTLQTGGQCRLVSFSDPFHERHAALVASLKLRGANIYADLPEMLAAESFDAIYLATPLHLHESQAVTSLKAGRHVYVEKPPCATLGEWRRMVEASRASGKMCVVGFQMQSHPAMHFLRDQLASGAIGTLQYVWASVRWMRPSHYYKRNDWAGRWLAAGKPVFDGPATNALAHVVQGSLALAAPQDQNTPTLEKVRGSLRRARDIQSYDVAYLEALTTENVSVRLAFTHATAIDEQVVVHCRGTAGEATLDWAGNVTISLNGESEKHWHFPVNASLAATLNFLGALANPEILPSVPIDETLPYMQMVNGALQSSGGSREIPAGEKHFHPEKGNGGTWVVDGLDEALTTFAQNPEAPPALFEAERAPWLPVGELSDELKVG